MNELVDELKLSTMVATFMVCPQMHRQKVLSSIAIL